MGENLRMRRGKKNTKHQQIVESLAGDYISVILCPRNIMPCIMIYSPVLSAPQEGYD